jgi:hypothetical protein
MDWISINSYKFGSLDDLERVRTAASMYNSETGFSSMKYSSRYDSQDHSDESNLDFSFVWEPFRSLDGANRFALSQEVLNEIYEFPQSDLIKHDDVINQSFDHNSGLPYPDFGLYVQRIFDAETIFRKMKLRPLRAPVMDPAKLYDKAVVRKRIASLKNVKFDTSDAIFFFYNGFVPPSTHSPMPSPLKLTICDVRKSQALLVPKLRIELPDLDKAHLQNYVNEIERVITAARNYHPEFRYELELIPSTLMPEGSFIPKLITSEKLSTSVSIARDGQSPYTFIEKDLFKAIELIFVYDVFSYDSIEKHINDKNIQLRPTRRKRKRTTDSATPRTLGSAPQP